MSCLHFIRQPLAEQTPQPDSLRALKGGPEARIPVADLASRRASVVRNTAVEPSGRWQLDPRYPQRPRETKGGLPEVRPMTCVPSQPIRCAPRVVGDVSVHPEQESSRSRRCVWLTRSAIGLPMIATDWLCTSSRYHVGTASRATRHVGSALPSGADNRRVRPCVRGLKTVEKCVPPDTVV